MLEDLNKVRPMTREQLINQAFGGNAKGKPSKYGNVKTTVDGMLFDSKREAARYKELQLMVRAKEISNLTCQVTMPINHNDQHICNYIADFRYYDNRKKMLVYEDSKGMRTAIYRLKKKLVRAFYGIEISEV